MSQAINVQSASHQDHTTTDISPYRSPLPSKRTINLSDQERFYSMLGGLGLVTLGLARTRLSSLLMALGGGALVYRGWTGHCSCYEAFGVDTSERNSATAVPARQGVKVQKSITINRPVEELYQYWRTLEMLPDVMRHLRQVEVKDEKRSHWVANSPFGQPLEWDAEIINEREPELIAWASLPGGDVETAGSVHLKPLGHGRGTALTVSLKYNPPGGKAAAVIASTLGQGLEQDLEEDLARFKSAMEAGEVPTVTGQPSGA